MSLQCYCYRMVHQPSFLTVSNELVIKAAVQCMASQMDPSQFYTTLLTHMSTASVATMKCLVVLECMLDMEEIESSSAAAHDSLVMGIIITSLKDPSMTVRARCVKVHQNSINLSW